MSFSASDLWYPKFRSPNNQVSAFVKAKFCLPFAPLRSYDKFYWLLEQRQPKL